MYKRYERQNDAVPDFFCVLQPSNMELGEKFCILQPPSLLIDAKSLSLIQGHKISKYNPFDENSFKKAKSRPKTGRLCFPLAPKDKGIYIIIRYQEKFNLLSS